ncbi:histidine phosphatase family protein [Kitasatospora sp. NPDC048538]|uniref:histidine phosphatase family protein n=1 Tax=unclassified Kitasatospora TaxID=2633591 RepID=UPI0033CC6A5F
MTETATRHLYLTRHGEAAPGGEGLTENGRRQADLLGQRLADRPITAVHHGPLPRAAQTAQLVGHRLTGVVPTVCEEAGDYVPHVPDRAELPPESADFLLDFLSRTTAEEREQGRPLARRAVERFTGPVPGTEERHELVVTHNFLIGWLVRHALDAPAWRWLGLNHANAALTVIRYAPGRPASVALFNDLRHLPEELRWTGLPTGARY